MEATINTGHFWTTEEDQALLDLRKRSSESGAKVCKEYSDQTGISFEAVRSRLKRLSPGKEEDSQEGASYEQGEDFINIICSSRRMLTKEDVIKQFKVDIKQWEIEKFKIHTSEGYRKDRKVDWHVKNGEVTSGDVEDSGKMLVVTMFHTEVRLIRKVDEIRARSVITDMKKDALNYAPVYAPIQYKKSKGDALYEIDMPDIHFGRLTWSEETGQDYDIQIAEKMVDKVLTDLLGYASLFPVHKILLPIGNDFYNVNSKDNTTINGTPQQEDTRWQKTYRRGRELAVHMIEMCSQLAPVDVLIIKGNHDEEKSFYMGDGLYAWFHNSHNVHIDNGAMSRKYYLYGHNLIGFTHGDEEKLDKLPSIMPTEVPDLWAKSTYREFHLGHKHKKYEVNEENGVVVRLLRSLVPIDAWTYDKGFVGALRAAEGFVWDKNRGLIAQFTVTP